MAQPPLYIYSAGTAPGTRAGMNSLPAAAAPPVAVAGDLGIILRARPEPGTFLRHNIKRMRSTFQSEHVVMGASSSAPPAPEIKPPTTPVRGAMLPLHVITSLLVTFVIFFCISIEIQPG